MTKAQMEKIYNVDIAFAYAAKYNKPLKRVYIAYKPGDNVQLDVEVCRAGSLRELGERLEERESS